MLTPELKNSAVYTDFQGLSELRREATGEGQQAALEKTARQFEALFVQMMLKSMREAGGGEGLFDSEQSDLYRDMYDKQLSLHLTGQGEGFGLAKMMVQQLQRGMPSAPGNKTLPSPPSPTVVAEGPSRAAVQTPPLVSVAEPEVTHSEVVTRFDSPQQFIEYLLPHAQRAAQRLGVDPRALLAQAALETGWGKAVIQHPDGSSSNNLFNIKADGRWQGERVAKTTVEYRQGVAAREVAQFRAYASPAESFEDYAKFIAGSPRYAEALQRGGDAARYVEALQEAGYATDPAYANKIKRILQGDTMANAGELKESEQRTLS